jgi:transposase
VSTKSIMDTTGSSGGRRRRSWPDALRREIVEATFEPGASVSIVARRYNVNANQVFTWRKHYREELGSASASPAPQLIPVTITTEVDSAAAKASTGSQKIEIDVGGKYRVHIGGDFDSRALRRILDVLERR